MPSVVSRSSIVLLLSLAVLGLGQRQRGGGGVERVRRQPTSLARHRSDSYRNNANTQERGKGGLAELLAGILPNTYYSRPKYRYPYYDNTGKEGCHCHQNKENQIIKSLPHQINLITSLALAGCFLPLLPT